MAISCRKITTRAKPALMIDMRNPVPRQASLPEGGGAEHIDGLNDFLRQVVELTDAQGGAIRALGHDRESLRLIAAVGLSDEFLQHENLVGLCGVCGEAVRDDNIHTSSESCGCEQLSLAHRSGRGFRHSMAIPLEYKGEPIGVFNLFFDRPDDSHSEISMLLKPIGQLLGVTLENALLERENARTNLLNERQMMATNIHDSLAQSLVFARMRLPLLEDAIRDQDQTRSKRYCKELHQELTRAHRGLRELITHFRAGMDGRGLLHGLRETVERFRETTGVELEFDNQVKSLKLPGESEVQIFYIVQEALANVHKHAKATHARLSLTDVQGGIEIVIEDNGYGLLSGPPQKENDGIDLGFYGLRIMRERAQHFGGRVAFENLPKGGARVRVYVPNQNAASEGE